MTASRRDEFLRVARRLAAERTAAAAIVDQLRSRLPLHELPAVLPDSWRTIGVSERLCDTAIEYLHTAPQRSVTAAKLATEIAAALDPSYPRVLRNQAAARAWCALGEAWRAAGDLDASLHALQHARAAVEAELVLVDERASVDLAEGLTLVETGVIDAGCKRIVAARRLFHELHAKERVAHCDQVLAALASAAVK